jgi:hypothetical protein
MDGDRTIDPLALQRLGAALRVRYGIQSRVPFRLHRLVEQLRRMTKEDDYLAMQRTRCDWRSTLMHRSTRRAC